MRRNSHRPSVAVLIAALALAACQSTPAAPPTQTPVNPTDTFATPGAPTPFLPTMTPVPSPTVRPTATAVPPTATVAVPTIAPTRGATPTPTPVIVNGQPKMWWVDQMVKQADGGFLAPRAVTESIGLMVSDFYSNARASTGQDSRVVAQTMERNAADVATKFLIGPARASVLQSDATQVNVIVAGEIRAIDIRGFGADGLTCHLAVQAKGLKVDVYSRSDFTIRSSAMSVDDYTQIFRARFDLVDGRWKLEEVIGSAP